MSFDFLLLGMNLNFVPVLVKHSRAQVKYQQINQSPHQGLLSLKFN